MEIVPREGESALSGPRPMEWSTVPYAPQGPDRNGNKRTSSLESPIMLLTGHQSSIYTVKFNPAGTVVASGSHDREIFLWNVHGDCKNFMVLKGHKNAILDLHWTTDGSQIISASPDKTLRAWDVETGKQIKKMAEHSSFVNSCCPSRRGPPLVVSGSDDGTAKLWDMRQRGAIQTFPDKYQITAVSFSDASDKIFTGGIDNDIKVWDLRKGEVTMTLQGHQDMITGMSLSPDGSYLLTNGMDCKLCIWDMRPYAPQNRCVKIFEGHQHNFEKNLLKCGWSPDESKGDRIVADYNWTEEWYPLYLTKDVPDDAPLGLTVFDQQLVLYKDGNGVLHCYQDRCPHRLAKLSEGQLIDGRLECLYHGWQFEGNGKCVKIPQIPADAKIPRSVCVKTYDVKESQGVVWVWMSQTTPPNPEKLPWFENFARPGFQDTSTIHELPYDHSILLENLMDPAHIPISHDRTDWTAKREDAQALLFEVTERTHRGFAGWWGKEKDGSMPNFLRFDAPCVLQNNRELVDKDGEKHYFTGLFLCRPTGQGKSMLIVRFGGTKRSPLAKLFPKWYFHQNASKVFEQDMGFLSSQNEVLMKEKVPTKELYINLKSSDTWVAEYRKWMDKVGHGMPYYFGHSTLSPPKLPAVVEHAPAGLIAGVSASSPAKGGIGTMHAPNLANRYFRHVIHCKGCSSVVKAFTAWKNGLSAAALVLTALAILASSRQWKTFLLLSATLCLGGAYACSTAVAMNTTNFIRVHRRL